MTARMIKAPCSSCLRHTRHHILHAVDKSTDEDGDDRYLMLECAGCETISLANFYEGDIERYYPSPVTRRPPSWMIDLQLRIFDKKPPEESLGDLLSEIYEAMRGGQKRLAAMGIRALLEEVMIDKVGDQGSFAKNLDTFCANGYASLFQRDQLSAILDVGHAAMHRSYEPSDKELIVAIDIAEGIIASIYIHPELAEKLAGSVPPRPLRVKPQKSDG